MDNEATLNYVKSTAALLGIPMDGARAERVAGHFQRTQAIAAVLDSAELRVENELAEIYCPRAVEANEYMREQLWIV